jgi:ribulose-bisphosphate carboxylase large chain
MISGRVDEIEDHVQYARTQGVQGILIAPMLVGCDAVRHLRQSYGMIVIAHPALTGVFFHSPSHGMTPAILLGSIFRLCGADMSVFPNAGGRFFFTKQECKEISRCLKEPLGSINPAFPCPAGGMSLEKIKDLSQDFGEDSAFLIGGALMQKSPDPSESMKAFMDEIRLRFKERLVDPWSGFASSCELNAQPSVAKQIDMLRCNEFQWNDAGRKLEDYKSTDAGFDFKDVKRRELIGKFGEKTSFDLRYFEIGPGGYSSLEKHVHEHVVIGVRGKGILYKNNRKFFISPNDIAYVGPLEAHQIRNEELEPFGFYCIVDHTRDKPMKAL